MKKVEKISIQPRWITKKDISGRDINNLIYVYKLGYGAKWISEEHFREVVMRNTSEVLELLIDNNVAAALNVNNKRITDIAVDPKFQGQGFGVRLLLESTGHIPGVWISVGIDLKAEGMIATVTDQKLNFLPVENKAKIEGLFRELNGVEPGLIIGTDTTRHDLLSKRLEKRGIDQEEFLVFFRPNSLHGAGYRQILFQSS